MVPSTFFIMLGFFVGALCTPLDDYVQKIDSVYGWTDFGEEHVIRGQNILKTKSWTGYTLNLTSLVWLSDEDFDSASQTRSVWWHYVVVIVPDTVDYSRNASLYVTGGSNGLNSFPQPKDEDIVLGSSLAMMTNSIVGVLFQIPNEHVTFSSDPELVSRTEGAIDSFTWDHYLKNQSDPTWLYYFPMTKAAVRAMDCVSEYVANKLPELGTSLDYYTVIGASKRGWTTWLTGAVDSGRVVAIIPVVLDAIHFREFAHKQWRNYGGWSYALADYYEFDIMSQLDTPEMELWETMDDPYTYISRLTMPKLVVNAGLDEFQMPEDSSHWWGDLPEPKHFLMTPNADHSEATGLLEILPAMGTWMNYLLQNRKVPEFTWDISAEDGTIVATLDQAPHHDVFEASMWYAYSCGTNPDGIQRRDFRMVSLDVST
jgi:PhoPQ-activated pathogenicity-related protein